jgi:hypothetical protein
MMVGTILNGDRFESLDIMEFLAGLLVGTALGAIAVLCYRKVRRFLSGDLREYDSY